MRAACSFTTKVISVVGEMVFIELVVLAIAAVYAFFWWSFRFWSRLGVPFIKPQFPFGNTGNPVKAQVTLVVSLQSHYDFCKAQNVKHCGAYILWVPIYLPVDRAILKRIMVSDSDYFLSRGFYTNTKDDPLSGMLFLLEAQSWRRLRTLLTPTFTSGKMKAMFPVILKCSNQMIDVLHKWDHSEAINIKELAACFTTDVICACSFGIDCNTCANPNDEIRAYGRKFTKFDRKRKVKNFVSIALPNFSRFIKMRLVPESIGTFFVGTIKKAMSFRQSNNLHRKDLLESMMEMHDNKKLSFDELTAQAFAFYVAGFETSSSTTIFCLLELAQNQEIQERTRKNVNEIIDKHNGEITYDGLAEMTYLRQVLDETLRMYPAVPITSRECIKDYPDPDTGVTIPKGTIVWLLLRALHYDPDYFPNPEVFDPERFTKENIAQREPFTYLPFGDGPRNCLGRRFGIVQTSLAVAVILRHYRFSLHSKTQLPIHYNPFNFTLDLASDFYLSMERITS